MKNSTCSSIVLRLFDVMSSFEPSNAVTHIAAGSRTENRALGRAESSQRKPLNPSWCILHLTINPIMGRGHSSLSIRSLFQRWTQFPAAKRSDSLFPHFQRILLDFSRGFLLRRNSLASRPGQRGARPQPLAPTTRDGCAVTDLLEDSRCK